MLNSHTLGWILWEMEERPTALELQVSQQHPLLSVSTNVEEIINLVLINILMAPTINTCATFTLEFTVRPK